MRRKKIGLWFLLLIMLVAFLPGIVAAQDTPPTDDWEFDVQIYGWMPNIYGKSATGSDFELDLDDILDSLQFMVMSTLGAKKDKWAFQVDVIYLDLESDKNSTANLPSGIPVNVYADVELKAWVVTPIASYNVLEQD